MYLVLFFSIKILFEVKISRSLVFTSGNFTFPLNEMACRFPVSGFEAS